MVLKFALGGHQRRQERGPVAEVDGRLGARAGRGGSGQQSSLRACSRTLALASASDRAGVHSGAAPKSSGPASGGQNRPISRHTRARDEAYRRARSCDAPCVWWPCQPPCAQRSPEPPGEGRPAAHAPRPGSPAQGAPGRARILSGRAGTGEWRASLSPTNSGSGSVRSPREPAGGNSASQALASSTSCAGARRRGEEGVAESDRDGGSSARAGASHAVPCGCP